MEQQNTQPQARSSCTWEGLAEFGREHVQRFIPGVLAEEVTAFRARPKSARRPAGEAPGGYRNG